VSVSGPAGRDAADSACVVRSDHHGQVSARSRRNVIYIRRAFIRAQIRDKKNNTLGDSERVGAASTTLSFLDGLPCQIWQLYRGTNNLEPFPDGQDVL